MRTLMALITAIVAGIAPCAGADHAIEVKQLLLTPEDGLLLGNGDLSVSVYQTVDGIVWRFGKSDVWDRRHDVNIDPKPAHIDEIARGIRDEGWQCPPYGSSPAVATKGTDNPKRMQELCTGASPSYTRRPYPCPKPVGELMLKWPADQTGLVIEQRLDIEQARLSIECRWISGVALHVTAFVVPSVNVLAVEWSIENWKPDTLTGNGIPPVWFSLYRWADPSIQAFAARFFADYRHDGFLACGPPDVAPLPPPAVRMDGSRAFIEQTFPPDPLFKEGFRYLLVPFYGGVQPQQADMRATGDAMLHLIPAPAAAGGMLAVSVTTSSDPEGPEAAMRCVGDALGENPAEAFARWREENTRKAAEFWAKSRVRIGDADVENMWYETLHALRCTVRAGVNPPGLFLPSTVQDYSHWHGDWHTNYNIQSPFFGAYASNHLEIGDAYFKAMEYFAQIGRKIAHDYYNARGVFIQLTGYPIAAVDDPIACVPMGRMAYMTGWAAVPYWNRYLCTADVNWLRDVGYPFIRDCALFYTDFLKQGDDGLYHAFPSNQGEDGFTGNVKDYTDRAQVMAYARYALRVAIRASEVLDADAGLREAWKERLVHCAGDDGMPPLAVTGIEQICHEANAPEFGFGRPYTKPPETYDPAPWPAREDGLRTWYFGQYPIAAMGRLRNGEFIAERDYPVFRENIRRWRHPNGLLCAMAVANYGHAGAWTESLGAIAPLQEMMLQSWDGALRVFPAWPKGVSAEFEHLRADGAFLVTAAWADGQVRAIDVFSEAGNPCALYNPWPKPLCVTAENGAVLETHEELGRTVFATESGMRYRIVSGS